MAFRKACAVDDLWEGEMKAVEIDREDVLVVWPDGAAEPCAFQGICPHQAIALSEGEFDGKVVTCRAHQWTFDGCTGQGLNPADTRLARYPVKVENGDVWVDIEGVEAVFTL